MYNCFRNFQRRDWAWVFFVACIETSLSGCSSSVMPSVPEVMFESVPVRIEQYNGSGVETSVFNENLSALIKISNGTAHKIRIQSMSLAGDKCAYTSMKQEEIGPGFSITYRTPEVGLIGLCFKNNEQLHFIEDLFAGIETKEKNTSLALYTEMVWSESSNQGEKNRPNVFKKIQSTYFINFINKS